MKMSQIKFYCMGIITGAILASGISYADEGLLKVLKMSANITVDGKQITLEEPILNYEGRSYLPVRKVAELTGAKIAWDGEKRIIGIQSAVKEVVKEVPKVVVKEIVKEVPKEIIKEVIKEIPKEVIKEVQVIKEVPVEKITYITVPSQNTVASKNVDMAAYNQEVESIKQKYEQKRNDAMAQTQLALKNYSEYLANRGLSKSGMSQQTEMLYNNQLQSTLNQINAQEQSDLNYLKTLYGL